MSNERSIRILWGSVVVVVVGVIMATIQLNREPSTPTITMTIAEGKEIAVVLNHSVWPDGAIIHKRLGNGWVCVEIDGHHLLVLSRGISSFGVAVDSCEK